MVKKVNIGIDPLEIVDLLSSPHNLFILMKILEEIKNKSVIINIIKICSDNLSKTYKSDADRFAALELERTFFTDANISTTVGFGTRSKNSLKKYEVLCKVQTLLEKII